MQPESFLFYIVAGMTGLCAIAVVVTQNIVRSAAYLLFTLGGTAAVFFMLGADFVGATQLLVYVGGTLVLVVFGVMLTAQGPFINLKTGAAEWAISAVAGLSLYAVISVSLLVHPVVDTNKVSAESKIVSPEKSRNSVQIGESFMNVTDATPRGKITGMERGPNRTRMAYLLPFEIVSVHLLVVLIAAAYLARAKRRRGAQS
jgi:NADH-quinone oxidoreductase subunit J